MNIKPQDFVAEHMYHAPETVEHDDGVSDQVITAGIVENGMSYWERFHESYKQRAGNNPEHNGEPCDISYGKDRKNGL